MLMYQEHLEEGMSADVRQSTFDSIISFKLVDIVGDALPLLVRLHEHSRMHERVEGPGEGDVLPAPEVVDEPAQLRGLSREVHLRHHVNGELLHALVEPQPVEGGDELGDLGHEVDDHKVAPDRLAHAGMPDLHRNQDRLVLLPAVPVLEGGAMDLGDAAGRDGGLLEVGKDLRELAVEGLLHGLLRVGEAVRRRLHVELRELGAEVAGEEVGPRRRPLAPFDERRPRSLQGGVDDPEPPSPELGAETVCERRHGERGGEEDRQINHSQEQDDALYERVEEGREVEMTVLRHGVQIIPRRVVLPVRPGPLRPGRLPDDQSQDPGDYGRSRQAKAHCKGDPIYPREGGPAERELLPCILGVMGSRPLCRNNGEASRGPAVLQALPRPVHGERGVPSSKHPATRKQPP